MPTLRAVATISPSGSTYFARDTASPIGTATISSARTGASDDIDNANPQPLGGGSIVIHH